MSVAKVNEEKVKVGFKTRLILVEQSNLDTPEEDSEAIAKCFQITRRYAEFSGAVMVLHEKFPLEGVDGLMLQLQDEVEKVILKMAAVFHNRKDQLIFLINNYDMMLSVLSVS
ncbi:Vacuolar protein sorting-associated protein 52 [Portunus trituberculatus]|uniref:Vacuolar protein sorting-associated protein 52 n=1 Tax=Portunus trituberculatus TaxID=210409 RepID=A0A5B7GN06_PORTR|nr:Vacuolar protein sorting-associated protein 52 [Portunus trituberculatus]